MVRHRNRFVELRITLHRFKKCSWTFAVLVPFLVLSACGGSELESGGADGGLIGGFSIFDGSSLTATYQDNLVSFHEDITACMSKEGFEYYNPDYDQGAIWPQEYLDDVESNIGESEFASKWGFGVIPVFLTPKPTEALPDPGSPDYDPEEDARFNEVLIERQEAFPDEDTPEGRAYWAAMEGTRTEPGCSTKASQRWLAAFGLVVSSQDEIERRQVSFLSDERVLSHYADWRTCMTADGYGEYDSPLGTYLHFVETIEASSDTLTGPDARTEISTAEASVRCGGTVRNLLPAELIEDWNEYSNPEWSEFGTATTRRG